MSDLIGKHDYEYVRLLSRCIAELNGEVLHTGYVCGDRQLEKQDTYDRVIINLDSMYKTIQRDLEKERDVMSKGLQSDFEWSVNANTEQMHFAKELARVLLLEDGPQHDYAVRYVTDLLSVYEGQERDRPKESIIDVIEKRRRELHLPTITPLTESVSVSGAGSI